MKNVIKISICITAIAVIAFVACNKEGVKESTSSVTTPSTNISSRGGEATTDQSDAEAYKSDILMWKTKIDAWRTGTSSTETMDATAAVEKLESVFNYYLCDAAKSYNVDKTVQAVIEVQGTNLTWNSTKVASTFEAIKAKVVESYATLSGADKGIRFIDLGTPTVIGGNLRFHIFVNMGEGVATTDTDASTSADNTKWGFVQANGDDPFNKIPCSGGANVDIAKAVNKKLGFFVGNLPINFLGISNPSIKKSVVLKGIENISTNKGAVLSPVFSSLILKNTLGLLDPSAASGPLNDYPNKGEYKFHLDEDPSEQPCFNSTKINNYISSNLAVATGNDYLGQVKALLGKDRYILVGVYISARFEGNSNVSTLISLREHLNVHYYAEPFEIPSKE